MMRVRINGQEQVLGAEATVHDALRVFGVDPEQKGIAVAVGDAVVPRGQWAHTRLQEGQAIEVVTAAQGG